MTTEVRAPDGRILAYIDIRPNGDKFVRDFYGKGLGSYDKSCDITRDFYGRMVARGDNVGILINYNPR